MTRIQTNGLQVAPVLYEFIEREALPYTGVSADAFWKGLAGLVEEFAPRDRELLAVRDRLQAQIDDYHRARKGQPFDQAGYERFLRDIGYVLPEPEDLADLAAAYQCDLAFEGTRPILERHGLTF